MAGRGGGGTTREGERHHRRRGRRQQRVGHVVDGAEGARGAVEESALHGVADAEIAHRRGLRVHAVGRKAVHDASCGPAIGGTYSRELGPHAIRGGLGGGLGGDGEGGEGLGGNGEGGGGLGGANPTGKIVPPRSTGAAQAGQSKESNTTATTATDEAEAALLYDVILACSLREHQHASSDANNARESR